MIRRLHRASYGRAGRLVPAGAHGLRAGMVRLRAGQVMDWHSTQARQELLIMLRGRVCVEIQQASRRIRRVVLNVPQSLLLSPRMVHRVVNRSRTPAGYIYVTAPTA